MRVSTTSATLRAFVRTLLFVISSLSGSVFAGHYEDGLTAYSNEEYEEAVRQWTVAASSDEPGSQEAQFRLGITYYFGEGVPKDYGKAFQWFKKASSSGYEAAQYYLGQAYRNGYGVTQDYVRAHMYFRLAAKAGNHNAEAQLGEMSWSGEGLENYQEALQWFTKAAEAGVSSAQNNLGVMYSRGQGVPQDFIQAHKWFNLSSASSWDHKSQKISAENRDSLASRMTPQQIAEAQRLAREWKPSAQ